MQPSTLPPSSPLYYDDHESDYEYDHYIHEKSFKEQILKPKPTTLHDQNPLKRSKTILNDYPTPEPSSSLGNLGSSSPLRGGTYEDEARVFQSHSEEDSDSNSDNIDIDEEQLKNGPKVGQFNQPVHAVYHAINDDRDHFVDVSKESSKLKLKKTRSSKKFKTIKLPFDGQRISIGRSSLCDVVLSDSKNLISRKHASVHYDRVSDLIVVKCYGVNALEVQTPIQAKVKYLGERRKFELIPEDNTEYRKYAEMKYKDLVFKGLTKFPRNLDVPNGASKFLVLPNEVLKIPRMGEVVLDIRGTICAVGVAEQDDPDLTDEEDFSQQKLYPGFVELSKSKDSVVGPLLTEAFIADDTMMPDLQETVPVSKAPSALKAPLVSKAPLVLKAPLVSKAPLVEASKFNLPTKPAQSTKPTNATNSSKSEQPTVKNSKAGDRESLLAEAIGGNKKLKKIKQELIDNGLPPKPLNNVSNSTLNAQPTMSLDKIKEMVAGKPKEQSQEPIANAKKDVNPKKRGRPSAAKTNHAEESHGKENKKLKTSYDYQDPKSLIDAVNKDAAKKQELLLEIEDLDDLKKILINHLAFSRLASTPLTQLRGISNKLEKLDKREVRLVLSDINCVGVIYRKGKDAAGKPLDEEYYYDTEKDDDQDRVNLVNSVKGGSSLRSCRKTHKQYYWKRPPPLPRY